VIIRFSPGSPSHFEFCHVKKSSICLVDFALRGVFFLVLGGVLASLSPATFLLLVFSRNIPARWSLSDLARRAMSYVTGIVLELFGSFYHWSVYANGKVILDGFQKHSKRFFWKTTTSLFMSFINDAVL
jgi:hypothetical protein